MGASRQLLRLLEGDDPKQGNRRELCHIGNAVPMCQTPMIAVGSKATCIRVVVCGSGRRSCNVMSEGCRRITDAVGVNGVPRVAVSPRWMHGAGITTRRDTSACGHLPQDPPSSGRVLQHARSAPFRPRQDHLYSQLRRAMNILPSCRFSQDSCTLQTKQTFSATVWHLCDPANPKHTRRWPADTPPRALPSSCQNPLYVELSEPLPTKCRQTVSVPMRNSAR